MPTRPRDPQPSHLHPTPVRDRLDGVEDPDELEAMAELEDYYASLEEDDEDEDETDAHGRYDYE